MTETFFGSTQEDEHLEEVNQVFWRCLVRHIREDLKPHSIEAVLDVGCHHGGLLELLSTSLHPQKLLGVEPLANARERAMFRLKGKAPVVQIVSVSKWPQLPSGQVDLVTCHEVLQLIADPHRLMKNFHRVLKPGGRAFVVVGSHAENPVWGRWRQQLIDRGHEVFDHTPMAILEAASDAGLHGSVQPLRRSGWIFYDPRKADFKYASVEEMFDHHYRRKLLFRFVKEVERSAPP